MARAFTFSASGVCGDVVRVTLRLQDGALDLGDVLYTFRLGADSPAAQTFSNPGTITIPASGTGAPSGSPATPYPATITVSGAPTFLSKVTVTLASLSHSFPSDIDALVVSPTGRRFLVASDTIGNQATTNRTYTFDDDAADLLPPFGTPPASGIYRPTNYDGSPDAGDLFPAPAPPAPYLAPATAGDATLASAFTRYTGGNPNGSWNLYLTDDLGVDTGSLNGGWQLTFKPPLCGAPVTAVSRKAHGADTYDIPLPLAGVAGVECRTSGGTNDFQIVVTFPSAAVTSVGSLPHASVQARADRHRRRE